MRSFARSRRRNSSGSWLAGSTLMIEELEIKTVRILSKGVDIIKFSDARDRPRRIYNGMCPQELSRNS